MQILFSLVHLRWRLIKENTEDGKQPWTEKRREAPWLDTQLLTDETPKPNPRQQRCT